MSEETEKLLKELVRFMVDERQILLNHIKLSEPRNTESELFLAGIRSALESLGKRIGLVIEAIEKLDQRGARAEMQLRTIEDLVRPLHAFAYSLPKPKSEANEPASGN